jgi:AcrR family transcriptional regulator
VGTGGEATQSGEATPADMAGAALTTLIADEMGAPLAEMMRVSRDAQETWHRRQYPDEGLRERKRRLTRQYISDAATTLFISRGFDLVRVSDIAERVGVSEKTIYNYFPTKESMVLDGADDDVRTLADALRNRPVGESITETVVRCLRADMDRYDQVPEALVQYVPKFVAMIEDTPALRVAWLEVQDRLAQAARDELAATAGIDPRGPEPTAAGRALSSLPDITLQSRVRHTEAGLRGDALREAILRDLDRAARLLESGLKSFDLPRPADTTDGHPGARVDGRRRAHASPAPDRAPQTSKQASKREPAINQARSAAPKSKDAARQNKEAARRAKNAGRAGPPPDRHSDSDR